MEITVSEPTTGVRQVAPHGRVDAYSAAALRERLDALLADNVSRFVLDLTEVPFLDSAGLAVLVTLLKRARQAGGDVALVWPKLNGPQRILQLTKFDRVFSMADSPEAAVRSLAP